MEQNKAQKIKDFVCGNCGGTMKWNISKQCFECSSCRVSTAIETESKTVEEHDFEDYTQREGEEVAFPDETFIVCSSCGTHIIFDKTLTATTCPMCGSTQVAEEKQAAGVAPDGIIPFRVDKEQAQQNFRKWVKTRWFAPNRLKQAYQQGKLDGMYLPFWTFDADAEGNYFGEGGTEYETTDEKGEKTTHVRWERTRGYVSDSYDDIAVCASEDRVTKVIDHILPYDTSEGTVPYASAYLSGFNAQRYAIRADTAVDQAKSEMEDDLREKSRLQILQSYDEARVNTIDINYQNLRYKHVLLPAWVSAFAYGSKQYLYMINGETGIVGGQRPFSIPKIVAAILVAIAVIIGAVMLFSTDAEAAVMPEYTVQSQQEVVLDSGNIDATTQPLQ